jgi:CheY-like chemotaxis protein
MQRGASPFVREKDAGLKSPTEWASETRILVADDSESDRFLMHEAWSFGRLQGQLEFVGDGEELLDTLRGTAEVGQDLPALVLLDLDMPRVDGFAALEAIKRDPVLRRVPVTVWATSPTPFQKDRALRLGADAVLTKPESFWVFVATLRSVTRYWVSFKEGDLNFPFRDCA